MLESKVSSVVCMRQASLPRANLTKLISSFYTEIIWNQDKDLKHTTGMLLSRIAPLKPRRDRNQKLSRNLQILQLGGEGM